MYAASGTISGTIDFPSFPINFLSINGRPSLVHTVTELMSLKFLLVTLSCFRLPFYKKQKQRIIMVTVTNKYTSYHSWTKNFIIILINDIFMLLLTPITKDLR